MARIDDPSAAAARQILGLEEVAYAESALDDHRVQSILRSFYAMTQLTPDVPMPDSVAARVMDRLAVGDEEDDVPETGEDERAANEAVESNARPVTRVARVISSRTHVPTMALIMLIIALVLSIGANVLLSRGAPFRPEIAIHLSGTGSSPDAKGILLFDGEQVVLHASGLAELASGYRYVAWSTVAGDPSYLGSLTMLGASSARLLTPAGALAPVVVVTIEPSASPSSPSGPQILVGTVAE